jgi:hypothetical protein
MSNEPTPYTNQGSPPPSPCNEPGTPPQGTTPPPEKKCKPLPCGPDTPTPPPLKPCDPPCCCPSKPGTGTTCLDDLIDVQTKQIMDAARAQAFKTELEDLSKKSKAARQEYTKDKYNDFLTRWKRNDDSIVDLITKLVCTVHCWWCVIECEICPLLYAIRDADLRLNGDGRLTDKVYSLRDLEYWQTRNRDAKKAVYDRIKSVLAAWEKPAQTIDKILSDNAKLVDDTTKILGTDSVTAIYSVFMQLVPLHLAIKPRNVATNIDAKYWTFCCCDEPSPPDNCCGPDLAKPTIRRLLIGDQPYIVDPDQFLEIICCLVQERYMPAKDQLAKAESDLAKTQADIARAQSLIDTKKNSVAADYKASVVNPIDCKKYTKKGSTPGHSAPTPTQTQA